jgi:tRNA dimethylallyltransferase
MTERPALFLSGPTGAGKSAVAMHLAHMLEGEIISVDAMQVYRGMDIGTAKPSSAEQALVRHHLINVVTLKEEFSAAQFVQLAKEALVTVQQRGKVPIFCGGTGFYFQAFLEGLGDAPPPDPRLRTILESRPLEELLDEYRRVDPAGFERIDRANRRRIVRALEATRLAGRPFSEQQAAWSRTAGKFAQAPRVAEAMILVLARERKDLTERINHRVDVMFAQGLVAEIESLIDQGLLENRTACQALGYHQVIEYLQGQRSLQATIELVKQRTRQYAKRQVTWFRHQPGVQWVKCEAGQSEEAIANMLATNYFERRNR